MLESQVTWYIAWNQDRRDWLEFVMEGAGLQLLSLKNCDKNVLWVFECYSVAIVIDEKSN